MPMFNSFAAEDQELTPTMRAEFDEWPDVLNDAAEVCLPIFQSGICNHEKSTVRLTAESVDGKASEHSIALTKVSQLNVPDTIKTSRLWWDPTSSGVSNE